MSFIYRLLPPPSFIDFPAIGLDISDRSIKYIQLQEVKGGTRLKRAGKKNMPEGVIVAGEIKKPDEVAAGIADLVKPLGVNHLVAALPEERSYTSIMALPEAEKEEIREAVKLGLPEKIPLPAGEIIFDFELLRSGPVVDDEAKISGVEPGHQDAVIYAFPKKLVESYLDVYLKAGLKPVSFLMETAALNRALLPEDDSGLPVMLIDFGKTRTTFVIVAEGLVRFSSTVNVAGKSIDEAIARVLKISPAEAEKIKKEKGMIRSPENRPVFEAVLSVVSAIADEIERHILFWNTHAEHVHGSSPQITRVILSGGDANLIGFREYLSSHLNLTVELANPWVNVAPFEEYIPDLAFNESLTYSVAMGLALAAIKEN